MKKIIVSLILLVGCFFIISACDNNKKSSSVADDSVIEKQETAETNNNSNEQVNVDNKDTIKTDNEKIVKKQALLTYTIEKPLNSNIKMPSSNLNIIFSSDFANPAFEIKDNDNIDKYIKIQPEIQGSWSFKDGKYISFIPKQEWQPDTKYTVTMNKAIFNNHYQISKTDFTFKTEPFLFQIDYENIDLNFDEDEREYSIHILFNYLFNQKQFKKEAKLTLDGNEIPFKVIFDKDGYGATIKSSKFNMFNNKDQTLNFTLPKIDSANSNKKLNYEINHTYTVSKIAEKQSFFIEDVRETILNDKNGNPRNVLVVTFSQPCNINDVLKYGGLFYDSKTRDDFLYNNNTNVKKVNMVPIYTGNNADVVHSFYVDAYDDKKYDEIKNYYFALSSNMPSVSGKIISKKYSTSITMRRLDKTISIIQKGSLLALKSPKMITFETRGLGALNIEVGRILPEQVQHIINFSKSDGLGEVSFTNKYLMDATNFAQYKNVKLPLSSNDRIFPSYATINIEEYLGSKPGLYYVKAVGLNKHGGEVYSDYYDEYGYYDYTGNVEASRFILVTDMYMITKENNNNQVDVFVASISKGEPVKNAKVEVIAKNGLPVISGQTDSNGYFKYEISPDNNDERNKPIAITAKKDDDFTYIPLITYERDIEYSKFDVGGEHINNRNALRAMVFTDRGIYRPGETVHIASIIKDITWKKDLSGIPVEIEVKSPKNEVIYREKYSLDNTGFIDLNVETQSHFTTGRYYVAVFTLNGNGLKSSSLGSVYFELKEFDTDTMRVNVSFMENLPQGWIKNDNITAKIKADNMYGTPAADRRVKAGVSFAPTTFYFPKYKGYSFIDPYIERGSNIRKAYSPELNESRTSNAGIAEYNLSGLFSQYSYGSYLLEFSGEVFEKGSGDGVIGYNSLKVSPSDYLVGYHTDSYLYYLDLNEKANVNFIAVDNQLNQIALDNLKYRLIQVTYLNQLIKDNSGRYRYNTVKRYNVLNSGTLSISNKGSNILLPTNINGDLIYEIVDKNNTVIGKVEYFVSGSQSVDTSLAKEAELALKLDKAEYKSGDTINMNITAPYTGYGLITIEKEKVYSFKWFKADTNTVIETIKIPKELEGNGYVNVAFIRDIASKDIYSKPLSYAVMPFSIDKSKRKIDIKLTAPEIVRPGNSVEVEYSADKSGKIIVYGVDEGILQVAGYKLPNPLDFFLKKIALSVTTKQTADLILPDYKILSELSAIGGGENALMAKMIANKLNPFSRVVEKPVVYWSKIIDVKAGEKKKQNILIPDYFNGSMKVMAVAVSEDGVGSVETAFIARSPIVMTPNMPYAAVAGDKFKLSVGVTNLIDKKDTSTITVTAKASKHLEIVGEKTKTIDIEKGSEALLLYDVNVLDELGSAEIILEAKGEGIDGVITAKITSSIRPAVPYRTNIQVGSFTNKSASLKVTQRDMYPFATKREVAVSSNPLVAVSGLGSYLQSYPYGCTEQITSKIYPVVLFAATNGTINTQEVQDVFNAYIRELTKRQRESYGFVYWSGGSYVSILPALYATQLLIDARELGFNVPDTLYKNAISYVQNIAGKRPDSLYEANNIAYALYLLARVGRVNSRALSVLEDYLSKYKGDFAYSYMGATYILYKNESKGHEFLSQSIPKYKKYYFYRDFYDSLTTISRYVYLVGRHDKKILEDNKGLIDRILSEINDGYYNSFSSAFALAALYGISTTEDQLPKYENVGNGITLDNNSKNKAVFSSDINNINVSFDKPNSLGYYYYINTSGFDKNIPNKQSNGINITKYFYDKNGNSVTEGKQGDEITVSLHIKQTGTIAGNSVITAITDLVPGGSEILTTNGISVKKAYESHEFREDRAIIYLDIPNNYDDVVSYKIKLLSSGEFTVPPTYAESLYNRDINAIGNSFTFKINEAK